jgi:hypothetical protein
MQYARYRVAQVQTDGPTHETTRVGRVGEVKDEQKGWRCSSASVV